LRRVTFNAQTVLFFGLLTAAVLPACGGRSIVANSSSSATADHARAVRDVAACNGKVNCFDLYPGDVAFVPVSASVADCPERYWQWQYYTNLPARGVHMGFYPEIKPGHGTTGCPFVTSRSTMVVFNDPNVASGSGQAYQYGLYLDKLVPDANEFAVNGSALSSWSLANPVDVRFHDPSPTPSPTATPSPVACNKLPGVPNLNTLADNDTTGFLGALIGQIRDAGRTPVSVEDTSTPSPAPASGDAVVNAVVAAYSDAARPDSLRWYTQSFAKNSANQTETLARELLHMWFSDPFVAGSGGTSYNMPETSGSGTATPTINGTQVTLTYSYTFAAERTGGSTIASAGYYALQNLLIHNQLVSIYGEDKAGALNESIAYFPDAQLSAAQKSAMLTAYATTAVPVSATYTSPQSAYRCTLGTAKHRSVRSVSGSTMAPTVWADYLPAP
jgi:hypothetical protein